MHGQVFHIDFDDGTSADIDLDQLSTDWWRAEVPGAPEELRKAAARAARRELATRDRFVGVKQERDAVMATHEALLKERAASARGLQQALHRHAPPLRREVPANAPEALVLSWGGIIFHLKNECTAHRAEEVVDEWARPRAGHGDGTRHGDGAGHGDVRDWLIGVLPFDLAQRKQLFADTGLVLMAGHLDQTGAGEGVRMLFDDFVRERAPPLLVCPLDGNETRSPEETPAESRLATEVHWADGRSPPVLIVASRLEACAEAAAERTAGGAGALTAGNLFLFPRVMPQAGRLGNLGAAVEVSTGFSKWRTSVALHPAVQAHGNALLGARDQPGSMTARIVCYTTGREARAVQRSVQLPARDRAHLDEVLAHDMQLLAGIEATRCSPTELVKLVHGSLLGEDDGDGHTDGYGHADGATGGHIINLGLRERPQADDACVESAIDAAVNFWPLRVRALHRGERAAQAAALTGAIAPQMGAVAADLAAIWPPVLVELSALLHSPAYPRGAFFPPARLQAEEGAPCLEVAEVAVRLTQAPALEPQAEAELVSAMQGLSTSEVMADHTAAATLGLLQQPCGIHSDKCDAGVYEVISYIHSAAPAGAQGGADLAMALRLRGGAIATRQNKASKKR